MDQKKSRIELEKDALITFINSEEFDDLPLVEQLEKLRETGQALIEVSKELKEEREAKA